MPAVIEIAPEHRAALPERPFPIRHRLADNPLFSLERLVELASTLPRDQIEYNSGRVAIDQRPTRRRWSTSSPSRWCAASARRTPGWC